MTFPTQKIKIAGATFNLPDYSEDFAKWLEVYNENNSGTPSNPGKGDYFYEYDTSSGDITVNIDGSRWTENRAYHFKKLSKANRLILVPVSGLIDGKAQLIIKGLNSNAVLQWNGTKFNLR